MVARAGAVALAAAWICVASARAGTPTPASLPAHAGTSATTPTVVDTGLVVFRQWLAKEHPGYGCDEGPARFRNRTVEAAYPGQRFYYALTYTRGIQPPFPNSISVVVAVDEGFRVIPFRPGSPPSYALGLRKIGSPKDARLAAAAVSILGSCDPGERRWSYKPDRFKAKKTSAGWKATYDYDGMYSSWVAFDRKGGVTGFGGSAPPVP